MSHQPNTNRGYIQTSQPQSLVAHQPATLAHPSHYSAQYAPAGAAPEVQRAIVSVQEIVGYIRRFWLLSTLVGLCAAIGLFSYLQSRKPVYESTAVVLLTQDAGKDLNLQTIKPKEASEYNLPQLVNNMRLDIESGKFRLSLFEHISPELRSLIIDEKTGVEVDAPDSEVFLQRLSSIINIEVIKDSHMVSITAKHNDAAVASNLANVYVEHFTEFTKEEELLKTRKVSEFLTSKAKDLLANVKEIEAELLAIKRKDGIISLQSGTDLITEKVSDLNKQLVASRLQQERLSDMLHLIGEVGNDSEDQLNVPILAENTVLTAAYERLAEARKNVASLATDFGRKHPQMIMAIRQEQSEKENLTKLATQAIEAMKRQLQTTTTKVARLESKVQTAMTEMVNINNKSMSQQLREQQVKDGLVLYSSLIKQMNEADIALQFAGVGKVRIRDYAIQQRVPIFPRKSLSAVVGGVAFAGCFLGIPLGFGLGGRFIQFASAPPEDTNDEVLSSPALDNHYGRQLPTNRTIQFAPAGSLNNDYPKAKYPTLASLPTLNGKTPRDWVKDVTELGTDCGQDLADFVTRLMRPEERPSGVIITGDHNHPTKALSAAAISMAANRLGLTTMLVSCENVAPLIQSYLSRQDMTPDANNVHKSVDQLLAPFATVEQGIYYISDDAWSKMQGLCVEALCHAHQCVDLVVLDAPLITREQDLEVIAAFASTCVLVRNESEDSDFPDLQAKLLRALPNCPVAGELLID